MCLPTAWQASLSLSVTRPLALTDTSQVILLLARKAAWAPGKWYQSRTLFPFVYQLLPYFLCFLFSVETTHYLCTINKSYCIPPFMGSLVSLRNLANYRQQHFSLLAKFYAQTENGNGPARIPAAHLYMYVKIYDMHLTLLGKQPAVPSPDVLQCSGISDNTIISDFFQCLDNHGRQSFCFTIRWFPLVASFSYKCCLRRLPVGGKVTPM